MAITSLPAPSLIVRQQFVRQVNITNQVLSPYVYGPLAHVVRYEKDEERSQGWIGTYDPVGTLISGVLQSAYSWPGKPVGSTLDVDFVRVHVKDAFLRYHQEAVGSLTKTGNNTIRSSSHRYATNSYGATTIGTRGVVSGDRALIRGLDASSNPFTVATTVLGVSGLDPADLIPASVSSPAASTSNIPASTASATVTPGTITGLATLPSADASSYTGLTVRRPSETYTITCLVGGVDGAATVQITSASGTDDVASVVIPAGGVLAIGSRGATATFDFAAGAMAVGDSWTVSVTQDFTVPTATLGSSTYTGAVDRVYIVEVVTGGPIGTAIVQVTSQDGGDSLSPVQTTVNTGTTSNPIPVGSFGPTIILDVPSGLMVNDKWTIAVTAAKEGQKRTLVLSHDLPSGATDISIELFVVDDIELSERSSTPQVFQWVAEDSQLLVRAGATASTPKWVNAGSQERLPLLAPSEFGQISQLYVTYRAWLAPSTAVTVINANDDLDSLIPGPQDADNPLKYAVALALSASGGAPVVYFNTGDPSVDDNWETALNASSQTRQAYGHVPLTFDVDVLQKVYDHVIAMNGETSNFYRVMWIGSQDVNESVILSAASSSDGSTVLATTEDDPGASGTQYTLLRVVSGNADFLAAGVRPGDQVRYNYSADAWGDETYSTYTVQQVLSSTSLLLSSGTPTQETVGKRVEIHRVFKASDRAEFFKTEAARWRSDLVRYVLAPKVQIGSGEVESYYGAAILAGMRAGLVPQQPMSRLSVTQIARVSGLDNLSTGTLDQLAAGGALILINDVISGEVLIRHAITTASDNDILAKREESMVSARHANLFVIVDRLRPFVSQINLSSTSQQRLQELLSAELNAVRVALQARNYSTSLGGQLSDLIVTFIGSAPGLQDTLRVDMQMELGRPGNYIEANVSIF
ncbi:MAG: hypothetical protein KatS3mg109_0027 [Pirellulaceae bacterium]|nr:MAG: hypothetical protein KatS3mg109_0027 [Pirellulaceae bacterium]